MKEIILKNKEKISFISLLIFSIYPIFIMILNYLNSNLISTMWVEINYLLGVLGFLLLCLSINKEKIKNYKKEIILLSILSILIFISTLLSSNKTISILGSMYRNDGLIMYINYFFIFTLGHNIKNDKYKKIILTGVIITSLILGFLTGFDITSNNVFSLSTYPYLFYNYNHLGYYLTIGVISSLILFINEENKFKNVFYLLSNILLTINIILNNTFGSYLGVLCGITFMLIINIIRKEKILKTVFSVLIFLLLSLLLSYKATPIVLDNFKALVSDTKNIITTDDIKDKSISKSGNRLELWTNAIDFIKEKPLFGYGIENLSEKYKSVGVLEDRPHSSILQIALFLGIPALLLISSLILKIFIANVFNIKKESLINIGILTIFIAYTISSLFGNSMYYTTPYYMIILGFLYKKRESIPLMVDSQ